MFWRPRFFGLSSKDVMSIKMRELIGTFWISCSLISRSAGFAGIRLTGIQVASGRQKLDCQDVQCTIFDKIIVCYICLLHVLSSRSLIIYIIRACQASLPWIGGVSSFFVYCPSYLFVEARDGILKLLRGPGINSKESIPPAYVAWRAGTTTLFLLGSWPQ